MATEQDLTSTKPSVHRVILLGDSGVGKTSMFYRIKDGIFRDAGVSTTQIAEFDKHFRNTQGEVTIQFVDTCGFETYHSSIPPSLLRNVHVVLFIYALDDSSSFLHLQHWYEETFEVVPEFLANKIIKFMVGNKSDLPRRVKKDQVTDNCSNRYGVIEENIFEVSAKEGTNIDELCNKISECFAPQKRTPKPKPKLPNETRVPTCRCS
ncbi:Ras-related protein Rab-30-like [Oopsacas minuta]|uniref:Ras-related protein Rab-30-like n=1 Tax=Oopsacas minuta TaxID=111878 RepID=A0AAV7JNB5_9METZ|nr:Ras-related protein Rab-30-like [Oopsacas minuta]